MPAVNFTTPVGRLIMGSLYVPQDKDMAGNPLTIKTGLNAGQPKVQYFFAIAIPKGPEKHWAETEWGQIIWKVGHSSFPQGQAQQQGFAWKVIDGDSTQLDKATPPKRPCDREGHPGNWIMRFTSGYAPKIYNKDGSAPLPEVGYVKLGYFVQVNANVDGNANNINPGVYLNHSMVALSAFGEEIMVGPDPTQAGFGTAALPPGASATPMASFVPPVEVAAQGMQMSPPPQPAITPNPAFLQVGGSPPMPPVPAVPDAPPARQMTAKAAGTPYEQWLAKGWTDALLVQHGYMAA